MRLRSLHPMPAEIPVHALVVASRRHSVRHVPRIATPLPAHWSAVVRVGKYRPKSSVVVPLSGLHSFIQLFDYYMSTEGWVGLDHSRSDVNARALLDNVKGSK